ncbi:hypothetical protein CVT25_012724 [Psilocybe cyanescens]|uniref:Uncharacterized protein n=1 Tax=Psilocybe cyanescens TaxID=93625 RepID=A0A409XS83_PSICY|nr:hypothetical protein CVT25_012724 [Psilocybe cyanescens]
MYRSQAIRVSRLSLASTRAYATPPPPPAGQPAPNPIPPKSDNTLMYTALGLAAAGGAYMFFKNPDEVNDLKAKARHDEEILKKGGRDIVDAAKARADDTYRQGEAKFDKLKAEGKENINSLRTSSVTDTHGRSIAEDLEAKINSAKGATKDGLIRARESTENIYNEARATTKDGLTKARDSTEHLYNEARSTTEQKAAEARQEAEKKAEQAKAGWSSWLGWGKSEVEAGANKVENESDRLKREAAQKVANAAGDVKGRAEKHA